jgi:hypothetical protein
MSDKIELFCNGIKIGEIEKFEQIDPEEIKMIKVAVPLSEEERSAVISDHNDFVEQLWEIYNER